MKQYLFTIGLTFNPSSKNNIELREFGLGLGNNGSNSLDLWASESDDQTRADHQWFRFKKMK